MKSSMLRKKPNILVDLMMERRVEMESTTMVMEGLGKGNGRIIGKMDMAG